ncbi:hypothetical protein [uncultured Thalassolituus sp.]|uniref:hypothetical protein n=1 Tax=uncultured Thalassolituus sp. TaxID=285273 RepID=UPI0026192F8B|nr:hypothetical protein [uncultured Thalassolituus sp.]
MTKRTLTPGMIHQAVADPQTLNRLTRFEWTIITALATWSGSVLIVALKHIF